MVQPVYERIPGLPTSTGRRLLTANCQRRIYQRWSLEPVLLCSSNALRWPCWETISIGEGAQSHLARGTNTLVESLNSSSVIMKIHNLSGKSVFADACVVDG
jgi:hypothetical protein